MSLIAFEADLLRSWISARGTVGQGFIASLAHPGGNITGFTFVDFEMIDKWLELLKEIAPGVVRVGLMFNPDLAPYFHVYLREFVTRYAPGGRSAREAA